MSNDEIFFEMTFPMAPVDQHHFPELGRYSYPDLYHIASSSFGCPGYLVANPIETFANVSGRARNREMVENLTMLKEGAEKFGVEPCVAYWSGNYSFGVRIETKNPTRKEAEKVCKALGHLKNIEWLGGMGVHEAR